MREIQSFSLKSKTTVPPGGWRCLDAKGTLLVAASWRGLLCKTNLSEEEVESMVVQYLLDSGHLGYLKCETSSIAEQGAGEILRIDSSKLLPLARFNYNPGLCIHNGKIIMAYRKEMETSEIHLCELGQDWQPVADSCRKVELPKNYAGPENWEDPRIYSFNGRLWMTYGNWGRGVENGKWKYKPTQRCCILSDDLNGDGISIFVEKDWKIPYAKNGVSTEKNWLLFQDSEKSIKCIYDACPHVVFGIEDLQTTRAAWAYKGWPNGLRGGTPPVLNPEDGLLYTFVRSHNAGQGRGRGGYRGRQYTIGCYAFEATSPYRVVKYCPEPLLTASDKDEFLSWAPACVFSSGCIWHDGQFVVSLGVHDFWSAIWKVDMTVLKEEMISV